MEVQQYQGIIRDTAVYPRNGENIQLLYLSNALNGEAGEVAEKVKKLARDTERMADPTDEDKKGIAKELGDVIWYVTALANEVGYKLDDILQMNHDKLMARRATNTLHGSGDNREES